MKIRSMTATFGKLERARLDLTDGLNLIHAPNESGKSTWCAFLKAMLYGIDTRDRDKKGYLADKNRYQPWSGAPMAGEIELEWKGRAITIRRGPKGNTPFGAFSAVYTGTQEPVPGLTAQTCGEQLTGVGQAVFERSAFLGGSNLNVTAAPELEKRIAALVSSGEEDVSYSQTEARLKEWLNRRKVNRSVGLIPKLEAELSSTNLLLEDLGALNSEISRLEAKQAELEARRGDLSAEQEIHRRLAQKELNRRYAIAGEELNAARAQLTALEAEASKYGPLPDRELIRRAQGELQYLKVLDDEIKQGEAALSEAEAAYVQAQIAAQTERFAGMSGEEADLQTRQAVQTHKQSLEEKAAAHTRSNLALFAGLLAGMTAPALFLMDALSSRSPVLWGIWGAAALLLVVALVFHTKERQAAQAALRPLSRFGVGSPEELEGLAQDYIARCQAADQAAQQCKTIRGTLNDRKARRENTRADLLAFVHSFAPQATDLFGCSAALSRALNLEHELTLAKDRLEERRRRREDLAAQGGQDFDTLEFLHAPERTPAETDRALATAVQQLEQVTESLNRCRGKQTAMGDPAALSARKEALETQLARRQQEYDAIAVSMTALKEANTKLQERFSPELNQLAGAYMNRLTGGAYSSLSLNRELEGSAARPGDVLPHSALYLSRGTTDQLYLAVRLAVCALCLPEKPPIVLDDALTAFDDDRLKLALELLGELAQQQQILLFSCQKRERDLLPNQLIVTL